MPEFDDALQNTKVAELHHKEAEAVIKSTAPHYGYGYVNLVGISIDVDALKLVDEKDAREAEIAVFDAQNKKVLVALKDPNNESVKGVLQGLVARGYEPDLYLVSETSLEHAWERYGDIKATVAEKKGVLDVNLDTIETISHDIHSQEDIAPKMRAIRAENSAERISKTIEVIFGGALALGASDVHVEPEAAATRVRYRLDGVLWDITDIEAHIYPLLISRLKLLSGLKLNIHDEAQDGRFTFDIGERELEVRSSVIPGAYGESIVMRLLDPSAASFNLEFLGLNKKLHEVITEELKRPNGAIITTGPTGSGKTTALYAFLKTVHTSDIKIITIEDPIEYKLEGIVQTQVENDYTFDSGLRSILRQDPDVIMVGEIRDRDVAETAVHAALTGHLVFSTLHTNSAVGAFPRLIDLGVDYRMIGSAFNLVLGQRLVRRLCESCKEEREATTEEQKLMARIMDQPVPLHHIYEAKGCSECGGSGFKGRIGIYEAVRVDKAVEEAVIRDPREEVIYNAAKPQGIPTMQQDGVMKVLAGITSLHELMRVVDLYQTYESEEADDETATL